MYKLCVLGLALAGCTDLPDHDDPSDSVGLEISCNDLFVDGNFDAGGAAWAPNATNIIIDERNVPNMLPITAQSGLYFAWLGGVLSATRTIEEHIAVPDGVAMLHFDAWAFVASETTTTTVEDTLGIQLLDSAGAVVATPKLLTNVDQTSPGSSTVIWTPLHVDIPVPAHSVTFRLISTTDASNNTNFFFDTMTLKPATCP